MRAYALNRRLVAVHEAGHVIIAHHFGVEGFGMIWREREYWDGASFIPTVWDLPADQRRIVGIAGAAATLLWLKIPAHQFFSTKLASRSDWELISRVRGRNGAMIREAVDSALAMLDLERKALLAMARQIIIESRSHSPELVEQARASKRPLSLP